MVISYDILVLIILLILFIVFLSIMKFQSYQHEEKYVNSVFNKSNMEIDKYNNEIKNENSFF